MKFWITLLLCLMPLNVFSAPESFRGLTEIPSKRTYNQKVYDNSQVKEGSKRFYISGRHIHYKDGSDFKDIDTTLTFDGKWKQNKASYHSQIPEYADGWFEFYNAFKGANHTIKAKPVCDHIKGVQLGDLHDGLGHDNILYKDAFGQGIDLRVGSAWDGLRKIIIVREKPAILKDLTFDFEMDFPVDAGIKDKEDNKWDKKTKLKFKDKTLRIGKDDKYSYFQKARIWDSAGNSQQVDIELYIENDKIYLRKTITKEILKNAVYPLYTDHPTNYYAGAGDGHVNSADAVWETCHNATSGTANYTSNNDWVSIDYIYYSTNTVIIRVFFSFDTSGVTSANQVDSASLNVKGAQAKSSSDNDGNDFIVVVQGLQASPTELVADDFDNCGDAVDNPTEGSDRLDISSDINEFIYNTWTLDSDGIGWIDVDGYTQLGWREGHDVLDDPMDTQGINGFKIFFSEWANTGNDPYLDITASEITPSARRIMLISEKEKELQLSRK